MLTKNVFYYLEMTLLFLLVFTMALSYCQRRNVPGDMFSSLYYLQTKKKKNFTCTIDIRYL